MMSRLRSSISRAAAVGVLFLPWIAAGAVNPADKDIRIRLALSDTLFQGLNENDGRAAMKAWAESLSSSTHLEVDGTPRLLRTEEIQNAVADHLVDAFSITMPEYLKIAPFTDSVIFTDEISSKRGLEYVLLVRRDSGINDLAGLQGRTLLISTGAEMSLASPWLETLLGAAKLESADRFFGRLKSSSKASLTVLPLYFGSADASLVTRTAFDIMAELNPQLRQKLQILALSPKIVPAFFCVHKDSSNEVKRRIKQALTGYFDTPNGRQILTLFQSGRLIALDVSTLRSSIDLLANYERLKARRRAGSR